MESGQLRLLLVRQRKRWIDHQTRQVVLIGGAQSKDAIAYQGLEEIPISRPPVGILRPFGSFAYEITQRHSRQLQRRREPARLDRYRRDGTRRIPGRKGPRELAILDPDKFPPAPYREYRGDPKQAYWFFDEETARAAVAFAGDRKKRERQMLTFVQDGEPLPVAKLGYAPLKYQPEKDGLTFKVEGAFLSEMPAELVGAGAKLGHAPGRIRFRVITGPAVQIGPATFRVRFDRAGMGGTLWLQEEHPGNGIYRHAVQPGHMLIPLKLTQGKAQTIAFPKIASQKAGTRVVELKATSSSQGFR
jgi:hypothetical protein